MAINRFSLFFLPFTFAFLVFTNSNSTAMTPTLESLNACYLSPASPGINVPRTYMNITNLFKKINKGKMPSTCTVVIPNNSLNNVWIFQKGLPSQVSTPIFIHSGPRDDLMGRFWKGKNGHGVRCTHPWIKNTIIGDHMVTFDYFYDHKNFDFGQGINIDCLDLIYTELARKNPKAPLVIAATCIGAKIALEFAANRNCNHIQALILESPFINVTQLMKNLDSAYGNWLPFDIKSVLKWYFSNSKAALVNPHADLARINPRLPIFIAHRHNDTMCTDLDMYQLIQELKKSGNKNIYLLVLGDDRHSHGHLNNIKEFAQATNAFLAAYNLPHSAELAADGQQLLDIAYANAQAKNPSDWTVIQA